MPPVSGKMYRVYVSTDGTTFTDTSLLIPSVPDLVQERETAEEFVLTQDYPIVNVGPRKAVTFTLNFFYTENTADLFEKVRSAFENQTQIWFRFAPLGGEAASGEALYTVAGYISKLVISGRDANSAEALKASIDFIGDRVVRTTA